MDSPGMYGTPGPGQYQRPLNESWPPKDVVGRLKNHAHIPVTVRIEWELDGEEQCEGVAVRWWQQHVYVELRDNRIRSTGVWVDAKDVRRVGPTATTDAAPDTDEADAQ